MADRRLEKSTNLLILLVFSENFGAGSGNRTRIFSLEGCCSTIELYPQVLPSNLLGRHFHQGPDARHAGCNRNGGGSRTRTYEALRSGFTVRPLCRSGHSPKTGEVRARYADWPSCCQHRVTINFGIFRQFGKCAAGAGSSNSP